MGVVHHSNYLKIIEEARLDWFNDNIINYKILENMGVIIPALSATENFISYLRYDDLFSVDVRLIKYNGIKMTFSYIITKESDNSLCYKGESTHFFAQEISKEEYKPYMSFRKKFPELHKSLNEQIQN